MYGHLSDPLWVHSWKILFQEDRLREYWPTYQHTQQERVNAITRLIVYLTAALFFVTQRSSYLVIGAISLGLIWVVTMRNCPEDTKELFSAYPGIHESSDKRFGDGTGECIEPSPANPFGNVPVTEFGTRTASACNYKDVSKEVNALMGDMYPQARVSDSFNEETNNRQFYQMPVTNSIADTDVFGQFLFGQGPNCKSDHNVCTGFDFGAKSNVPPM